MLHRRVVRPQHVELLLREVTDVETLAGGDLAAERFECVRDGLHDGRLALTVRAEDADALPGQHRPVDVADDDGRRGPGRGVRQWGITEADVVHRQHRIGQVHGLLEFEREFRLGQHRSNFFHALQRLHAALRLLGLARLGLEAVDELLQVRDFLLLLRKGCLLQQQLLCPHILEGAVVAAVAGDLGPGDVERDLGHRVEKLAIVTDDQHRAGVAFQPRFEPQERIEIEVVRGLVEQ